MKFTFLSGIAIILTLLCLQATRPTWGFFGHRRINRLAVFTLPPEMGAFFKKNIEYITEHAVDPDKRRYSTRHEAVRHYIDIDHWGTYPFPEVPRNWTDALIKYATVNLVTGRGDTLILHADTLGGAQPVFNFRDSESGLSLEVPARRYRQFFRDRILPQYYEDEWVVDCDSLSGLFGENARKLNCTQAYVVDHFSEYGILPYHLLKMQRDLTEAFRLKNVNRILRLSAEMGHYIGDAHVPLHTTENYNGQMTGQDGIHAFWESRLPELYADKEYDFWVGSAEYLEDPHAFFWKTVLDSHALVDSVFAIEKDLRRTFPADQQYCFEERLGITVRTQCEAFARAYSDRMQGMVEARMRQAIHAVASSWYTAWVDAGQPDLMALRTTALSKSEQQELEDLEARFKAGAQKGRQHE